jgi:hypothetical protein
MSSKSCLYIEVEPDVWFYLAENEDSPEEAWDWREYATAFGPFDGLGDAMNHRAENRSDISGCEIRHYDADRPKAEIVRAKIDEALQAAADPSY